MVFRRGQPKLPLSEFSNDDNSRCGQLLLPLPIVWLLLAQAHTLATVSTVRHRPEQNRVTWKTPSSEAFTLLQEPVGVLASYLPHAQMQV
jgi:hypothetical protein